MIELKRSNNIVLVVILLMVSVSLCWAQEVGKWERFEVTLSNNSYSGNPFDLELVGVFTSPTGRELQVLGFYDGDNLWKIRFMPDELGNWTYHTQATDSDLNGHSGSINVLDSGKPGIVMVDQENPFAMKFADGGWFFDSGANDPEAFFSNEFGPQSRRLSDIEYLASLGCNSLYIGVVNACLGDGGNNWRVEPWEGDGCPPDFSRFDLTEIHEWEQIFDVLLEKEIVINFVFYLDDVGGITGKISKSEEDRFFKYMIARFASYPNLVWILSEEYEELFNKSWAQSRARFVKEHDPYNHLLTIHQVPKDNFTLAGDPNFDLTALQYRGYDYVGLNRMVRKVRQQVASAGRRIPVSIIEWTEVIPGNRDDTRKAMWSIAAGGGYFQLFTRFKSGTDRFSKWGNIYSDAFRLRSFVEKTQYYNMEPHNELVDRNSSNFCLAKPGSEYLVYLANGGSVNVNLTSVSGRATVKWYDPRSGDYSSQSEIDGQKTQLLSSPFNDDAVLYIKSNNNAPPVDNSIANNINPSQYQLAYLKSGDTYYIDRNYTIQNMPEQLEGLPWIKTANDDKVSNGDKFVTFDLNEASVVFVGYDRRIETTPTWFASWTATNYSIVDSEGVTFNLYSKNFSHGKVELGSNNNNDTNKNMYTILINPGKQTDTIAPKPPSGVSVN